MKQIWAPWRIDYVLAKKPKGCIFCKFSKMVRDEENFILYRGAKNFIILNNYPYNNGHLMIASYRHEKDLECLNADELAEHFKLVSWSVKILKQAFKPDGFNIGLNLGKVAGAGVEGHLHTHVVPRWHGDTNFMPVIADTKVMPEALRSTYNKLKNIIR